MFPGQVRWNEPSAPAGGRAVRDNVANGDNTETAFALVYAALLSLSDKPCSETGAYNNGLDTDAEGGLLVTDDSGVLGAAINIGSGAGEYPSIGTHRDDEPILGYFVPQYSGSSMDRLMSQRGNAQVEPAPSVGANHQIVATDVEKRQGGSNVRATGSVGAPATMSNTTGVFNKSQLSVWMDAHALSRSSHHCAMYCRLGMEAAGLNTGDRPQSGDAGDYGPFLLRHGAQTVPQDAYTPQVGDVVVFDKTALHPHGHIEMYDGQHWVSDFKQRSFSPYYDANSSSPFTIYRLTYWTVLSSIRRSCSPLF